MNSSDIARIRLQTQQIANPQFSSPKDLVGWMGAVQAQDYRMVKWALGVRLPGSNLETIEDAIKDGDIIRTHLLRPTWHIVAANDIRWILDLTAPRIQTATRSRHKQLGITKEVVARSNRAIEEALTDGNHLSRKELVTALEDAGFENKDNMASHLLLQAELDGVICSGATKGRDYTYALMDERVPDVPKLSREESLAKLARTYFRSHGPATLDDFVWWSGLTLTDSRKALEMIKPDFQSEAVESREYWFSESSVNTADAEKSAFLIPAYDEFLISYKSRNVAISENIEKKAISNNGIFRPVIVVGGQVVGIWKRSVQKTKVTIETEFFDKPSLDIREQVEESAGEFARFLVRETVEVTHHWK
ncbi:MAG: winged helix DNA-binding domain-containing protein [Candidatus Marinimicrobia bacterium]|nr:winged helix DNA-binding domain-containing protein [Candidatus Neomarinimicrobiota bacterium]MCF7829151.1 winged helix DNA-binding domain-containing protein [Candidatus Neomarinimicrobiota bacterium]MCF7881196.1 winged helix DNA-binding domain-containing protein [Candidatus Neomarinimicrobiota bacterium]